MGDEITEGGKTLMLPNLEEIPKSSAGGEVATNTESSSQAGSVSKAPGTHGIGRYSHPGRRRLGLRFSQLLSVRAPDRGHTRTIKLKLRHIAQFFNSMDPSPFIERDLDEDAEEFIVSWAQEFAPKTPIRLRIYLDQWPAEDPKELIRHAVHNYFAHRAEIISLEFNRLLAQGRTSLFIGLVFLAACLLLSNMLLGRAAGTWVAVAREGLTIAGWVAMWRPMQIYLYDWWPLRRRGRIYAKLAHMPVEVVPKGKR